MQEQRGFVEAMWKWFDVSLGYGFLTCEGLPDILIRVDTLRDAGLVEVDLDQTVRVRYEQTRQGLAAVEIQTR